MNKIQICNIALSAIGSKAIADIDEDSRQTQLCKMFYDTVLELVLRDYSWEFAESRAKLELLCDDPLFGFKHQYKLPSDCVKVRDLCTKKYDFVIENRKLLTNLKGAELIYTRRESDTEKYSTAFTMALAYRLAAELAVPVTSSKTMAQQMYTFYLKTLKEAKKLDHESR